jgi:hypothetical protein
MADCQWLRSTDKEGKLVYAECYWVKNRDEEKPCVPCLLNLCLVELQQIRQRIANLDSKFIELKVDERKA